MIKKLALPVLFTFFISVFTGCNTVKGIGKDIEGLGKFMQKGFSKSEKNKPKEKELK